MRVFCQELCSCIPSEHCDILQRVKDMVEKKKKIMLLGGLRYLIPVIEAAHELGLHVITCDYLPDNIAHKYSDEYHNVSIIDKEAVLKLAQELQIDGIMSFAVDPGVVTAAYVQEQMGLPAFGPYESVCILQDKARFREFLRNHSFNCPWSYGFSSVEDALAAVYKFSYPAIVKPTDSAGSKGVSRVDCQESLRDALEYAFSHSLSGNVIVEQFLEKVGCSSGSDCFVEDGKFTFISYASQRFDEHASNPYTPAGTSWPSTFTAEQELELSAELQRLITLLQMNTSIFNVEVRVATDGKPYIMEVSPRGGGNKLAEMLQHATGAPLIENAVRACVGLKLKPMPPCQYDGHRLLMMIHSALDGEFQRLIIDAGISSSVVNCDLWVSPGDIVREFRGANDAIGCLFFKCDSYEQVEYIVNQSSRLIRVDVR